MKATTLDTTATVSAANPLAGWASTVVARFRTRAADRALRRQLADMDPAMLRDIGITDDEIARVRAMDRFTAAAWQ